MNDSVDDRLVDEMLVAYVQWREESSGAQDAHRRWSSAPLSERTDAFREYVAPLNNEEDAASDYAELIRRLRKRASSGPETAATNAAGGGFDPDRGAAARSHRDLY
jgi:hypothetical protein